MLHAAWWRVMVWCVVAHAACRMPAWRMVARHGMWRVARGMVNRASAWRMAHGAWRRADSENLRADALTLEVRALGDDECEIRPGNALTQP